MNVPAGFPVWAPRPPRFSVELRRAPQSQLWPLDVALSSEELQRLLTSPLKLVQGVWVCGRRSEELRAILVAVQIPSPQRLLSVGEAQGSCGDTWRSHGVDVPWMNNGFIVNPSPIHHHRYYIIITESEQRRFKTTHSKHSGGGVGPRCKAPWDDRETSVTSHS